MLRQRGQESVSEQAEVQTEQSIDHNKEGSEAENQEPSESVSKKEQETNMEQKTLVVYFSATGTTKLLAEYAAEILEADIYEIMPEIPYTETDLACVPQFDTMGPSLHEFSFVKATAPLLAFTLFG